MAVVALPDNAPLNVGAVTMPVNVGLANGAFVSSSVLVAYVVVITLPDAS